MLTYERFRFKPSIHDVPHVARSASAVARRPCHCRGRRGRTRLLQRELPRRAGRARVQAVPVPRPQPGHPALHHRRPQRRLPDPSRPPARAATRRENADDQVRDAGRGHGDGRRSPADGPHPAGSERHAPHQRSAGEGRCRARGGVPQPQLRRRLRVARQEPPRRHVHALRFRRRGAERAPNRDRRGFGRPRQPHGDGCRRPLEEDARTPRRPRHGHRPAARTRGRPSRGSTTIASPAATLPRCLPRPRRRRAASSSRRRSGTRSTTSATRSALPPSTARTSGSPGSRRRGRGTPGPARTGPAATTRPCRNAPSGPWKPSGPRPRPSRIRRGKPN